jgi:hypothetical protein
MAPPEHESELSPDPHPGWGRVRRTTAVIGLVLAGTLAGTATGAFMLGPEDPPRVAVIEVGEPRQIPGGERTEKQLAQRRAGERAGRRAKERAQRRASQRATRRRRRNAQREVVDPAGHAPAPGAPVLVPPGVPAAAPAPEAAPVVAAPAPPADDEGESESDDDDDDGGGED